MKSCLRLFLFCDQPQKANSNIDLLEESFYVSTEKREIVLTDADDMRVEHTPIICVGL